MPAKKKPQRYYIDTDSDGHYFVIEEEKRAQFTRWIEEGWVEGRDDSDELPVGVVDLETHFKYVLFENYEVL